MIGSVRLQVLAMTILLAAAAFPTAAQQLDRAYLGAWASDAKECSPDSDRRFEITLAGMSGPEFLCTMLQAVPQGEGWAMRFACAAEGTEYKADSHWQLLPNGHLRISESQSTQDYVPCRQDAVAEGAGATDTTTKLLAGNGFAAGGLHGADVVRHVQQRLSAIGFDPGGVDGRFGARTARALRAFEVARGLPGTGRINPANLAALDRSGADTPAVLEQPAGTPLFDPEAIHATVRRIIASYRPSTEAYDYREEAGRAALATLLKAPPFGSVDVSSLDTEPVQTFVGSDPYGPISNPGTVLPARRFFVSPAHKALMTELKAARLAQPGLSSAQARQFAARFDALIAETKARFGLAHPAVGFVLDDFILLRLDMISRFEGGFNVVNAELSGLHREAAVALRAGWSSSPGGRLVADHLVADITSAIERTIDWRNGCGEHRGEAHAAYVEAAAIDHAASGPAPRQLGWLLRAARCAEDAGQAEAIMRARVQLARIIGSGEAEAQTLAELAAARFQVGDRAGAVAAYREVFRIAMARGLAVGYETGLLADEEWVAAKRTAPAHWQALKALDLSAELDFYIAHNVRRQIAERTFDSTYGASLVSSFVDVLEGSGRTALADDYYTYLGHTFRREGMRGSLSPLYMMSLFTAQRIDAERYEEVLPMLERSLKLAETLGDRHFTAVLVVQLARAHTERGALDEGLRFARKGLVMIRQGGLDGTAYDIKAAADTLEKIVTGAEREQSRLDNAVGGLAAELQGKLEPVCAGTEKSWSFPALPANLMLSNPVIAGAFLQHPVVARYIECFDRLRGEFLDTWVEPGDGGPGDRISDVALLLGLLGEREKAAALLEFLLVKGESGLGAQAAVLQGLMRAGKGEWFAPQAGRVTARAMAALPGFKQKDVFPQAIASLGLDLLAIGERGHPERLYREIKRDWQQPIAARGWGCLLQECQYFAVMAEAFDGGRGADDYFDRIPSGFVSYYSGAQADTSEADAIRELALNEGHMQLRAGRYRLAEVYFQLASEIVSGYGPAEKGALASEGDVDVATAVSRIKYERGDPAAARAITTPLVGAARKRFAARGAYSTEAIVRWSHRLHGLFEVHFDSLDANPQGEIAAGEDDFFAFQYLQTTRTAATIAKLAERARAGSGEAVRRHQDLSRELGELYSAFAVAKGARATTLLDKIAATEKALAAAQKEAEASDPAYAARPGFRFLSLAETRERLSEGEAVVLSFVGRHHAYLWLVTRDAGSLRRLAVSPGALDEAVRALRFEATGYNAAAENKRWPLEPFRKPYLSTIGLFGERLDDVDRLYFVPHGLFDGLPLGALLADEPPDESMTFREMRAAKLPWLIRRMAINMLPSLQAIEHASPASDGGAQRPFLGVGNPDFGAGLKVAALRGLSPVRPLAIPTLPETETEITRIAKILRAQPEEDLLVGARASETVLRRMALDRYRIVTFATHGILAGEFRGVSEPALVLAMPTNPRPDDDGLLTASEVSSLRLKAELVVLSACNTAGSDGRPGAEGLSGLANAFFYAGAQNLVVTHWAIPSNPAVDISVGMIEEQQGAGATDWAKALRASVLKMMDGEGPVAYVHPGAWGAHMVVGAEIMDSPAGNP